MSQHEAIVWSGILAMIELALFISLGSQSKTHAVLLLIAVASYRLLQVQSGPFDRRAPKVSEVIQEQIVLSTPEMKGFSGKYQSSRNNIGWRRIWIVLTVCWISVICARVFYELESAEPNAMLTTHYRAWSEFEEDDFDLYEGYLRWRLCKTDRDKVDKKVERSGGADKEKMALSDRDRMSKAIDDYLDAEELRRESIALSVDKDLEGFDLPDLTGEKIDFISRRLGVTRSCINKNKVVARKLLRAWKLKASGDDIHIFLNRRTGWKPAVNAANYYSIILLTLSIPIGTILVFSVVGWVVRGFKAR